MATAPIHENLETFSIEEMIRSALRVRLSDILESQADNIDSLEEKNDESESYRIRTISGQEIRKVCIMGTIVDIQDFDGDVVLYIDDGTERALVRISKDVKINTNQLSRWMTVRIIGKPSLQQDPLTGEKELVIDAELLRVADSDMEEFLHRLDAVRTRQIINRLNEMHRRQQKTEMRSEEQVILDVEGKQITKEEIMDKIKHVIHQLDINQKGVAFEEILETLRQEGYQITEELLDELILDLMDEGELFEPKAGYYQLVY